MNRYIRGNPDMIPSMCFDNYRSMLLRMIRCMIRCIPNRNMMNQIVSQVLSMG